MTAASPGAQDFKISMRANIFLRSFLLQACWNYERMQSLGLMLCLEPWLAKIHGRDTKEYKEALKRHQEYFNTQPYMASLIIGTICAVEKDAAGKPEEEKQALLSRLRSLKLGLASGLAGFGDSFFWAALRPFCAAVCLATAFAAWPSPWSIWAAVAAYLIIFNLFGLGLRWAGLTIGYREREKIALLPERGAVRKTIGVLRICGGIAALIACALGLQAKGGDGKIFLASAAAVFLFLKMRGQRSYQLYAATCLAGIVASAAGWL